MRRCEMFPTQTLQSRSTPMPSGALGPALIVLSSLPFASNRFTFSALLSETQMVPSGETSTSFGTWKPPQPVSWLPLFANRTTMATFSPYVAT